MPHRDPPPDTPRELLLALRARIHQNGHTIASIARLARIPRPRLTLTLNGRGELTGPQWRRLYKALGIWHAVMRNITAAIKDG